MANSNTKLTLTITLTRGINLGNSQISWSTKDSKRIIENRTTFVKVLNGCTVACCFDSLCILNGIVVCYSAGDNNDADIGNTCDKDSGC